MGCPQAAPPLASAALCPFPVGMQQGRSGITAALLCDPTARSSWAKPMSSNLGINPQRIWTWRYRCGSGSFSPLFCREQLFSLPARCNASYLRRTPRAGPGLSNELCPTSSPRLEHTPARTLPGFLLSVPRLFHFAGNGHAAEAQGSHWSLYCIALVHPAGVRNHRQKWFVLSGPVCV